MTQSQETGPNWTKWRKIAVFFVLGVGLVVTHQNCAPAPGAQTAAQKTPANDSQPVSIIDNPTAGMALNFPAGEAQAPVASQQFTVQGNCSLDQQDAVLGWKIQDASGSELASGFAECLNGQFNVSLSAQQLTCGQAYLLTAQLGRGEPGQIQISRSCE